MALPPGASALTDTGDPFLAAVVTRGVAVLGVARKGPSVTL